MRTPAAVLAVILGMLILNGCAQADPIDGALAKAKQEEKAVMLELGSVGCVPCEQMKPVMAKLSDTHRGKLEVIFVDVKKDRAAAQKYGIYVIPVQVFLDKNGKEFHRHIGFYPYEEIAAMLRKTGI